MEEGRYRKSDGALSDIARRFDVPERKAKLAKLVPGSDKHGSRKMLNAGDDLPVYCICKSPDIDRFMIMCDECEEWFHGDCIKITEKEAKYIKYFYCSVCRKKNPFLKIKYRKNKKKEKDDHKKHEKFKKLKMKKKKSESSDFHKSASAPQLTPDAPKKVSRYEKDDPWKPEKKLVVQEKKSSLKIYSSESEEEVGKANEEKDKELAPKTASTAAVKEEAIPKIEPEIKADVIETSNHPVVQETPKKKKSSKRCGYCENCLRKTNCGVCDTCFDRERFGAGGKLQKCRLRRCLNKKSSKKSKNRDKARKRKASPVLPISDDNDHRKKTATGGAFNSHPPQNLFKGEFCAAVDYTSTNQCFGPGCTNSAAPPSKYCSDECGRRLARDRLYHILPQRIQEWNGTATIANEQGKNELEKIRVRMNQARDELTALERKFRKLESIISAGKSLSIEEKRSDADDDSEAESDHSIYCVVCGHSTSLKGAIKHMDKCYIKIESLMSFGSVYPTRIEGSQRLFCDAFNEQQQTYCKRLQVLCPEHTKEPKVTDDEICGCPLSCDIYGANPPTKQSHFCRQAKRKCSKHFKWETMYRAEVDLQRIRQWLKIDEIFDEERRIRTAMSNRAGVVSLLLHQTTVHDPSCTDMRTKPTVSKKPAYRLMI